MIENGKELILRFIKFPVVIVEYDKTFWLHLLRDFIICLVLNIFLSLNSAATFTIGFNLAWEYQDGLHNDGSNILDFIAGIIGVILSLIILKK